MDRPHRDSRQHNGITVRHTSQLTFATKSANCGSRDFHVRCLELDLQRPAGAASSIITAMDYDKLDITAIYDAALALTPEGLQQWLDLIFNPHRSKRNLA
jgi:hypothetical protein